MRYVQVRGYLKSLGSRYGSHAFLWINVPVKHLIPEMHSERGLGMGSVFPSDPWMVPESCRSEGYFEWGGEGGVWFPLMVRQVPCDGAIYKFL